MSIEKKIIFRCEGSHTIGMGHVMRCLNLAQWLKGKHKVFFVINQNPQVADLIRMRQYPVFEIAERTEGHRTEEKTINTILSLEPHMVINDIRDTDTEYMQALKARNVKMINFDDTSSNARMAHVLIDANRKPKEDKCFGPDYMVMSSLYAKCHARPRRIRKQVRQIVVSMGGSDPQHITEKIIRSLDKKISETIHLSIVVGPLFQHPEHLAKLASPRISLLKQTENLAVLLSEADIAIVSGGVTMYESLAVGTPTIVIAQNKPQAKNARRMEKKGCVLYLGEGQKISDKKISRKVIALIEGVAQREKMSMKSKKEVDGKGIFRVLEQIEMYL